ncbi:hypothetical protein RIF29_10425 [Crotalaria pallida]|uniref:Uncharacterized protein n=1 Tax=Crotalaria pallida TaxID=3830 RepID=A0AAN9IID8_CROPI
MKKNLQYQQRIQQKVSKLENQNHGLSVEIPRGLSTIKKKRAFINDLKEELAQQEAQLSDLVSTTKDEQTQQSSLSEKSSTLLPKCQEVVGLLASMWPTFD